ncbi:MAG TPA: MBL fold metallo-hydrolase [Candidatus Paceibacterota bacterium]|nr:MBL fold metallo-hydrolase [Candidatus Paceibacterota bacterium]
MKITFHGGAKSVTGSNYLFEAGGLRIVVDCGMFQGSRYNDELNYEPFPYDAKTVDFVFITHSHVDHMGRLPKMYREGFRGTVYGSEPTLGIIEIALPDTLGHIVREAAEASVPPLWDDQDMEKVISLFRGVRYREPVKLNEQVSFELYNSCHILGSSVVVFTVSEEGQTRRVAFSGDMGNPPSILLKDIDYPTGLDYTTVEAAYGSRFHEARTARREMLLDIIRRGHKLGGTIMVPSFAVERTQEFLLELDHLFEAGELPDMPVFVDSPLAINITNMYSQFSRYFNEHATKLLSDSGGLFQFPWLRVTPTVEESKAINTVPGPKMVIAGSGMSTGGRILHHERRYLPDPGSTILFIGYQVSGSLGRRIRDKEPVVRIMGEDVPVKCHVYSLGAYSAHADQDGLVEYCRNAGQGGTLKRVFVVQGEDEGVTALAGRIAKELGTEAVIPEAGQTIELS